MIRNVRLAPIPMIILQCLHSRHSHLNRNKRLEILFWSSLEGKECDTIAHFCNYCTWCFINHLRSIPNGIWSNLCNFLQLPDSFSEVLAAEQEKCYLDNNSVCQRALHWPWNWLMAFFCGSSSKKLPSHKHLALHCQSRSHRLYINQFWVLHWSEPWVII